MFSKIILSWMFNVLNVIVFSIQAENKLIRTLLYYAQIIMMKVPQRALILHEGFPSTQHKTNIRIV